MTFRRAETLGGHIRKGEHGGLVVYANRYIKTKTDDASDRKTNWNFTRARITYGDPHALSPERPQGVHVDREDSSTASGETWELFLCVSKRVNGVLNSWNKWPNCVTIKFILKKILSMVSTVRARVVIFMPMNISFLRNDIAFKKDGKFTIGKFDGG
jgi:hypothetical protein